jgi:hypothetical protein
MLLQPFSTRKPKKPGKFNSALVAEKRDSPRNDPDLDGEKLDFRLENETVLLTQQLMANLFQTTQ